MWTLGKKDLWQHFKLSRAVAGGAGLFLPAATWCGVDHFAFHISTSADTTATLDRNPEYI